MQTQAGATLGPLRRRPNADLESSRLGTLGCAEFTADAEDYAARLVAA